LNATLENKFVRLERDRIELLRVLASLSEEVLNKPPDATHWSIIQILSHLLTAEGLTLTYLKKTSLGKNYLRNSGTVESLKTFLLTVSQRLPLKYKAPSIIVEQSPVGIALPSAAEKWSGTRKELKNFLETIEDRDLLKLIYKHPVAGRLNVVQALTFMHDHFRHHLPQIYRLLP
jgi:uncharacterized damage-inducible protein DinB